MILKRVRLFHFSCVFLLFSLVSASTAHAVTYFSIANGPWNINTTWSTVGFGGAPAGVGQFPIAGDIVNIQGFTVFVPVASVCTTLNVNAGGVLQIQGGSITVNGVSTIGGVVNTLIATGGTNNFNGLVTINVGGTWDLSNRNPATSFSGGITMNGLTFNNGTGNTAFAITQNLAGNANMTFGGVVTPAAGITVTNNNTATVTISNSITLTGNWTQGLNSTLQLTGATPFTGAGVLNASANLNTVNYTGGAVTVAAVNYRNLGLGGTGIKTITNVATINGALTLAGAAIAQVTTTCAVTGILTVGAGTTLTMGDAQFTVTGASNISGSVNTQTGATGTRTFTGLVTIIAPNGSWDLTATNPVTSFGGGIAMNGLLFNNGTNNAGFSVTQALTGASAMTFGTITPAAATTLTNNNTSTVTVTNITTTGNFTQGNNAILVLPGATPFTAGAGVFTASANNTVNYTGAAQTVRAVAYSTLGISGSGVKTMTGVTTVNGSLTIAGTASVTAAAAMTIGGTLTLTSGTFVAGAFTHNVGINWINNGGTFTNTGSTIRLNGTAQSIGGSASSAFNNLILTGNGTTTLNALTTVAGTLNIEEGTVVNLGGLTTHTTNVLRLNGNGQSAGTWGGTGSGAANVSSTYFSAASGLITVAVTSTQALPYSEPFTGEPDGATSNASPPWSVTQAPSSGTFAKEDGDLFLINDTGAQEGVWQTADLDLGSGVTEVAFSLDIVTWGTSAATDYLRVYYVWDSGPSTSEVQIAAVSTGLLTSPLVTVSATGHTKVRLVIRGKDNSGGQLFGIDRGLAFDNINIIPIRTLYSRATSNWSTSGTWSTVAVNGADCACTPSAAGYDKVIIGGARTVTLTANAAASNVAVNGTADTGGAGTLALSTFSLTLGLGANVTVNNGGIINSAAGSALIFSDNQSHTITDNGSITVGSLTVNNTSLINGTTATYNGAGTFSITGNYANTTAFLGAVAATTNMPMTIGGVATINLLTTFTNNSTVNMTSTGANALTGLGTWTQNANSTLNYAGSSIDILDLTADNAVNLVNYNGAGAQTIFGTDYWNLTLSTSGLKTLGADISLRGNWSRTATATFAHGNNGVDFVGTVAQTITGNGGEAFFDLTINNSFGTPPQVTLGSNISAAGTLQMSSGRINLATHTLNLTGSLTHNGTSAAGWAYGGTFTRAFGTGQIVIGNVAGLVPIGTATNFRPFHLAKSSVVGSNGTISLTHVDFGTTQTGLNIADTNPVANIIVRNNSQWNSTLTGGTGSTFAIRYGGNGLGTVTNLAHIRSMLANSVIGTNVTATVNSLTDPRAERSGLTPAQMTNTFYIGSTDASSALPITLVSFKGIARSYGVELLWKTESEINNDRFTILHSDGKTEFESIGDIAGNGTSTETHEYKFIHYKPVIGKNYYKLRQADFDGMMTMHGTVMVEVISLGSMQVSIYPNPVSHNRVLNMVVSGLDAQSSAEYEIIDTRGVVVKRGKGTADETGSIEASIDFSDGAPGIYILKFPAGQFKFVIE